MIYPYDKFMARATQTLDLFKYINVLKNVLKQIHTQLIIWDSSITTNLPQEIRGQKIKFN